MVTLAAIAGIYFVSKNYSHDTMNIAPVSHAAQEPDNVKIQTCSSKNQTCTGSFSCAASSDETGLGSCCSGYACVNNISGNSASIALTGASGNCWVTGDSNYPISYECTADEGSCPDGSSECDSGVCCNNVCQSEGDSCCGSIVCSSTQTCCDEDASICSHPNQGCCGGQACEIPY